MLNLLVNTEVASASGVPYQIDDNTRAILLIFMGRIYLYQAINSGEARARFAQAIELIPEDGRPYACMGEYHRVRDELEEAFAQHQRAVELSPQQPDGYIGEGLLFENEEKWNEAATRYEQAIRAVREKSGVTLSLPDIALALDRLLAPVSGHLYLQLAKAFIGEDPQLAAQAALAAIKVAAERARSLRLDHQGEHTELAGYRLLGEIYEALGEQSKATEAYYEAGRRFSLRNEHKAAIELLEHALQLDPNHTLAYWVLSESLFLSSYRREVPFVDEAVIKRSLQVWEAGAKQIGRTNATYSGLFVLRALINESLSRLPYANRWELWWEAAVYLERAIISLPDDPERWAWLGHYHLRLSNRATAMQALRKALSYDPHNLSALDFYAGALADLGQFSEAEETIDKRRKLTPHPSADAIKAYILVFTGRPEQALELINSVISKTTTPKEIGYFELDLRATCYWILNEPLRAKEDYSLIWSRYTESDTDNQLTFGWAAYRLGMLEQASAIFTRLLDDPIDSGQAHRSLGLCYLAQGELSSGIKHLEAGIELASNVTQLDELRDIGLQDIKRHAADASNAAQLQGALYTLQERISARRVQVQQMPAAEEELDQCLRTLQEKGDTSSWAWIGAHAATARLYVENTEWQKGAAEYEALLKQDFHAVISRFPEALNAHERLGFLLASNSDPSTTADHFRQSLRFRTLAELPDTIWDLIGETPFLISSVHQYETLNTALQVLAGDPQPSL
jgi:tetratricopeptide (TPR) repeat protein